MLRHQHTAAKPATSSDGRLPQPPTAPAWRRFGIAILAVFGATLVRIALTPWMGEGVPMTLFALAVLAAGQFGGLGPGLLATALGVFLGGWIFVAPTGRFELQHPDDAFRLALFTILGVLLSLVADRTRRAEAAQRLANQRLEALNARLESLVQQRTEAFLRARAEADLTGRRLASIMEGSRDLIAAVDPDHRLLAANSAFRREFESLFGVQPREGDNLLDAMARMPQQQARVRDLWNRALSGEAFCAQIDLGDHRRRVNTYEITGNVIRDEDGRLVGASQILRDVTDRVHAEREIKRLNAYLEYVVAERSAELQALLDNAPIGFAFFDAQGRYLRVNRELAEINGLPADDHVGRRIHDLLPDIAPSIQGYIDRVFKTGETIGNLEHAGRTRAHDGELRHWLSGFFPVRDADGTVVSVGAFIIDTTERKRREDFNRFTAEAGAVLASSLDYEVTLASLAQLVVPRLADWCAVDLLDDDGSLKRVTVAHVDPQKTRLAQQLHEQFPQDLDAPHGVPNVLRTGQPELVSEVTDELIRQAVRNEEHRRILHELGLRSYMCLPLVARGRTLGAISFATAESRRRYDAEDVEQFMHLARRAALAVDNARLYQRAQEEIAERARVEAALRESQQRYKTLLHAGRDAMFVYPVDPDGEPGRFVEVNDEACRRLGYTREEFLRLTPYDISPRTPEQLRARLRELLERGQATAEGYHKARDGRLIPVEVSIEVFRINGKPHVLSAGRDITERKRAEEHQEMLLAELSHRVKNTLATVQSIASRSLQQADDLTSFANSFEGRLRALSSAHSLLTNTNWTGADLKSLLDEITRPYVAESPHRYVTDGQPLQLAPKAALSLSLVFHELTTNAVKYGALSADSGLLRVQWRIDGDDIVIAWAEAGGPPARTPTRHGFGSTLIARAVEYELDGSVEVDYAPNGLHCEIRAPQSRMMRPYVPWHAPVGTAR